MAYQGRRWLGSPQLPEGVTVEQIGIAFTSAVAIWLANDARPGWRKWACVFGLTAQPFWFYATWKAGQWGIFALSFFYAYSWARGFYNQWVRK